MVKRQETSMGRRKVNQMYLYKMVFVICYAVLCAKSIDAASIQDTSIHPSTLTHHTTTATTSSQQEGNNEGLQQNHAYNRDTSISSSHQQRQQEILTSPRPMATIQTSAASLPSKSISSRDTLHEPAASVVDNNGEANAVVEHTNQESSTLSSTTTSSSTQMNANHDETKTNPKILFLIKLLFITYYGSLGALMPYLPVYYKSLGHSGQAIGLLGAVKPLTTFIVAPIWGMISDYYQNPSLILQITFITSMALQLFLPIRDDVNFLLGMVFITALFNAPVKSLIDSMVMNKLSSSERGQYGRLRLWGQLGFGLGSSIVGFAMSKSTIPTGATSPAPIAEKIIHDAIDVTMEAGASAAVGDQITKTALQTISDLLSNSMEKLWSLRGYQLAFLAYGIISIPAFFALKSFQRLDDVLATNKVANKAADKAEKSNPKILEGLNMLFHNSDALLFFFLVFVVGTTSGIIENFAYVRISEVGGTGKEMGLCRLVSSLCGAPMFWFSGPLTSLLGVDRVLVLTLVAYIFRFLNYALIRHPLHALPAEGMRGLAFGAFWSTGTVFAHKISPAGMSATMLMFMNAMYGGLGQSTGAIIGGKLQSKFGTTKTFLYSALVDFLFVCLVTSYLSIRKDSSFKNPKPIGFVEKRD